MKKRKKDKPTEDKVDKKEKKVTKITESKTKKKVKSIKKSVKTKRKKVVTKPAQPKVRKKRIPKEKPVHEKPVSPTIKTTVPIKPEHKEKVIAVEPKPAVPPVKPEVTLPRPKVKINELTTVRELAEKMKKPVVEIMKKLLSLGAIVTINQRIDPDPAELITHEYNMDLEFVPLYAEPDLEVEEDIAKMVLRAPVVTVMGHVDHGKTTLLDAIRETNVTASEIGGITQHIGAYKVQFPKGDIVFLDTPGHELFTAMRAHGAKITDIVVLVVAGDDGVMPQTVEAINHARSAGVPIIVAINKADLPSVNPEKVRQQLASYNLIPDSWGGDVLTVEISARNKINIDKLLEAILFKAELMELKTNPDLPAQGMVVEAKLDARKGSLGTVLIQKGTLKIGDAFICGLTCGKVKSIITDRNEKIDTASPSTPVEILGFAGVPFVGDRFIVVKNPYLAKEIIEKRENIIKKEKFQTRRRITLEEIKVSKVKQLNLILKTDVIGSLGAIRDAIDRITSEEVKLNIVHAGVGVITMSDVNLAISTNSIIIGFNIRSESNTESLAKQQGVEIRIYRIIYELIDDIKKALVGLLEPKFKEKILSRTQVKKVFQITNIGTVAGCLVMEGKIKSDARVRLIRDNTIICDTKIATLRRFKDDVREVEKGYECGVKLVNYSDIKTGDVLEVYMQEKMEPHL